MILSHYGFGQLLRLIILTGLFAISSCLSSQKSSRKTEISKPDWVISRPVDRGYYQGIGVAMVNSYTQGHVEEAKKKALNDLISEISVHVKSTSLMQQIEQNDELNNMFQSITNVSAENDIEGYELVGSWGDEREYWVYYRLSRELYNRNKLRRLDRAKNIGSQFYESGMVAKNSGEIGRAFQDYVKGLSAMTEYLDEEILIPTGKGKEYLVDALMSELIGLNRSIEIRCDVNSVKARIARPLDLEIHAETFFDQKPLRIMLTTRFTKGGGEAVISYTANSVNTVRLQRVTGGQAIQEMEITIDVEGMAGEEEGKAFISKLIRLKCDVPAASVNIEAQRMLAGFILDEMRFGNRQNQSDIGNTVKKHLAENGYSFSEDVNNADVRVKLNVLSKKGEEHPLGNRTLYTAYVDLYITVTEIASGRQVYYKGFSNVKGSRSGSFEMALKDAESSALAKFEKELLPEVCNLDLEK